MVRLGQNLYSMRTTISLAQNWFSSSSRRFSASMCSWAGLRGWRQGVGEGGKGGDWWVAAQGAAGLLFHPARQRAPRQPPRPRRRRTRSSSSDTSRSPPPSSPSRKHAGCTAVEEYFMCSVMGRRVLVPPPTWGKGGRARVQDGFERQGRRRAQPLPAYAGASQHRSPGARRRCCSNTITSCPSSRAARGPGPRAHVVELEAHERLDQRRLAVGLVANHQDGGAVKGLLEVLGAAAVVQVSGRGACARMRRGHAEQPRRPGAPAARPPCTPAPASAARCRPRTGAHCCWVGEGGGGGRWRAVAVAQGVRRWLQGAGRVQRARAALARMRARRAAGPGRRPTAPHLLYPTAVSRLSVSPASASSGMVLDGRLFVALPRGRAGATAGSGSRAGGSWDPVGLLGA
jgi:hypothetical protein